MSSSETAAGVSTPRSVNSSEMYPGVAARQYTLQGLACLGPQQQRLYLAGQGCRRAGPSHAACKLSCCWAAHTNALALPWGKPRRGARLVGRCTRGGV